MRCELTPQQAGADCKNCPFAVKGKPDSPVPGTLVKNSKGVLVGESPGDKEVKDGRPLTGPTGIQLDAELEKAGIERHSLTIINAIACKPIGAKTDSRMQAAARACRPYFKRQLRGVLAPGAKFFIMGRWAHYAVDQRSKGVFGGRGFIKQVRFRKRTYQSILSWHPTFAFFFQPYEWGTFSLDLQRFGRLLRGEVKLIESSALRINPTAQELQDFLYKKQTKKAVDIETGPHPSDEPDPAHPGHTLRRTALSPKTAQLKTIAFGDTEEGISVHWLTASRAVKSLIRMYLADPAYPKVFHNGWWYDIPVLARYKLPVRGAQDTRDKRKAICSTSRLSLGYLASLSDDTNDWKHEEEVEAGAEEKAFEAKGMAFTDDLGALMRYNAQDTIQTARLDAWLESDSEWQRPETRALYRQHCATSRLAAKMYNFGMRVHRPTKARLTKVLTYLHARRSKYLHRLVNQKHFKATSDGMRALVYTSQRKPLVKCYGMLDPVDQRYFTKGGKPSVNYNALLQLILTGEAPPPLIAIIEQWWKTMEPHKALSTFVDSEIVNRAIWTDGYLRPGWNTCGPDTGRWSCADPNIMNLARWLRSMYIPSKGCTFVHADKKQLEVRVVEAVSGDEAMWEAISQGRDLYAEDVRAYFPDQAKGMSDADIKAKLPKLRDAIKAVRLGAQYAASTKAVYEQVVSADRTIAKRTVEELHKKFLRRSEGLVDYWREEAKRVARDHFSETRIMKRRRWYPVMPKPTEIANYPIQGSAADIMNIEIIKLDKVLSKHVPSARLVAQLHDAVDVDVPRRHAGEVKRILEDVMGSHIEYTFGPRKRCFPVDIHEGENWRAVA